MIIATTPRLILRRFESADLDPLYAFYSDPQVRRYFPEGVLSYDETREELEWHRNGHPRRPELGLWATVERATGVLVGRCGLLPWTIDGREEVEVAYLIGRPFWSLGYGTEAARAVRDVGFQTLGLQRLVSLIDRDNAASIRVAEKIGMVFEKEARDELGEFLLYAIAAP